MVLTCEFVYCVYDADAAGNDGGFNVVQYRLTEVTDAEGTSCPVEDGKKFTAVGYYLSKLPHAIIHLKGVWKKDAKRGLQFSVSECSEEIEKTEFGITNFLASGLIKGVSKGIAARIYKTFGDKTIEVMDNDIERLIEVPGISAKKLKKIKESYSQTAGSREMISFLGAYKIAPKACTKLVQNHITLDEIKKNPYVILNVRGFGFPTADMIALGLNKDTHSSERLQAAVMAVLRENEMDGHAGIPKETMVNRTKALLNKVVHGEPVNGTEIASETTALISKKMIVPVKGNLYRADIYWCECDVGKQIVRLAMSSVPEMDNVEKKLREWEIENGVSFDEIQERAVTTALSSGFSVITGGPGRGKTTVAKAIVELRKKFGKSGALSLMAPTGRAARRLSESTGESASTIHLALMLGEDAENGASDVEIDAEQVLVDETSMVDIWLCRTLLNTIATGTCVTFIGDPNQLPSVGPGAVLRDIINSGCVPVVKLEKVYRQADGSTIVENADRIEAGNTSLVMNDEFKCYRADTGESAAKAMIALYRQKCGEYGREEVALLSPFHHAKSEASSDRVNECLQQILNPEVAGELEVTYKNRTYRKGDIVMQTKNKNGICNGDIGVISKIYPDEDGETVTEVVFDGSGLVYCYSRQELDMLELAYCMTYHKVQGSEYKCVIGCMLDEHGRMLRRNLFYTGVTRAKEEYIFVGTRKALETAVTTVDSEQRITLLAEKIRYAFEEAIPFKEKNAG